MIQEVLITTVSVKGEPHIAPMGVHVEADLFVILPFKPSLTLNNLLATQTAVINYCDDVRIFAGCLTGRRDWSLSPAGRFVGFYLSAALAHEELELQNFADDPIRPKLFCKSLGCVSHKPFKGFNRAQHAVLELAILVSRLDRLPWEKISMELDYLRMAFEKTAGDREQQAWDWLMQAIEQHRLASGELL
ncbi:MAG: DUF447 domain-containing protein [Methylomonas sp.]|jgi:hypothetical protein